LLGLEGAGGVAFEVVILMSGGRKMPVGGMGAEYFITVC